ncbi:hypothetical protein [Tsukamurella sp. USMM236]|uniref:hypothetical protein n=1 Tax=Tsukamurella sp. USMM236 TaxID=3081301 RepID=UPI003018C969
MSFWKQWKDLTQHTEGVIIALGREREIWNGLKLDDPSNVVLTDRSRGRNYQTSLGEHLDAINDRSLLYGSILIHSYALCEATACDVLGIDSRDAGGVESWAGSLLTANGRSWENLDHFVDSRGHVEKFGGKAFLVEAAVARNCCAHKSMILDQRAVTRLNDSGNTAYSVGDEIGLDYDRLYEYRNILRTVMRVANI